MPSLIRRCCRRSDRVFLFRVFVATILASSALTLITMTIQTCITSYLYENLGGLNTSARPLLTIFTTVKEARMIPHHELAFKAVLTNWPSFKPYIQPVLFLRSTNSSLARRALVSGWDVLPLKRTNKAGTPFLKDMFGAVFEKYHSMLYGFANGDILFDDGILKALLIVSRRIEALENNVLLIGRRTNVFMDFDANSVSMEELKKDHLRHLAAKRGVLSDKDTIDYFFFSSNDSSSLNWSSVADVVVGRPAYDSYMIGTSIRQGVNVIDCTNVLTAVHLSEAGVISHGSLNQDSDFNRHLIGSFDHSLGFTSRAKFRVASNLFGRVKLIAGRAFRL